MGRQSVKGEEGRRDEGLQGHISVFFTIKLSNRDLAPLLMCIFSSELEQNLHH